MSSLIEDLLNQLEDQDATDTGKKGLSVLSGGKEGPADPDGSNADGLERPKPGEGADLGGDDKLAELVASLTPEEKAKLRALLDAGDQGPVPQAPQVAPAPQVA